MARTARRPFPTGGVVPSEDLVGREAAIEAFVRRVYDLKSSVYLSEPRQVGKTSVVVEALRRVRKKGGRAVYVDCTAPVDVATVAMRLASAAYDEKEKTVGAFARLRHVISGLRPTVMHADTGLAVTFFGGDPPPPERRFERALALADELAVADRMRAVVVFDEFPRLAELGPQIFDHVRAHLQHAVRNTAYVFMGSQVGMLRSLFGERRSMLHRLASPFDLPAPSSAEWIRYIEGRFSGWRKTLGSGEAARLVELTGGHPRDLMEVCRALLEIRLAGPRSAQDVDLALERALAALSVTFEQIWKSLTQPTGAHVTAARIAIRTALYTGRARKTVQRSLERLDQDGLIRRLGGRGQYEFTEPLFAVWVRRQMAASGQERALTPGAAAGRARRADRRRGC